MLTSLTSLVVRSLPVDNPAAGSATGFALVNHLQCFCASTAPLRVCNFDRPSGCPTQPGCRADACDVNNGNGYCGGGSCDGCMAGFKSSNCGSGGSFCLFPDHNNKCNKEVFTGAMCQPTGKCTGCVTPIADPFEEHRCYTYAKTGTITVTLGDAIDSNVPGPPLPSTNPGFKQSASTDPRSELEIVLSAVPTADTTITLTLSSGSELAANGGCALASSSGGTASPATVAITMRAGQTLSTFSALTNAAKVYMVRPPSY